VSRIGRILVVDDEVSARTTLADLLRGDGYDVEMAADAFKALGKYKAFAPQVVVTDLQMPGMDGVDLVRRIRAEPDPAAVIVMTAFGDVPTALEAVRAGAAEYLTKPFDFDEFLVVLQRVLAVQARPEARQPVRPGNLVGATPAMRRIVETIDQVAQARASVLVTGEAGTGKELVAGAIHQLSPRARRPFVKVNCGADVEIELLGIEHKHGRIEEADGGTLFLDEVTELPPAMQIKLLRVLQDNELERIGGSPPIRVDVRVIAATRRDLASEVAGGRFREDLFYRLRVIAIAMPPLRERASDIPALAKLFVHRYARANERDIDGIAPDALDALLSYPWPGNVRELENAIESAVVLTKGSTVDCRALPDTIHAEARTGVPPIPGSTMADLERYAIVETLKATGGSTSKAAEILGISKRTVQYRLHQYHEAQRSQKDVVKPK
jgi:DNA-binding NtrC family response regulator